MATKKKRYLDITNGVEVPRYYSRMDATYAPQRKIDEKANARFDQQAVNAKNDKERTKAIHAKDNYNRNRTRYRQVVTSGRDFTRAQKAKQNKVDANKKAFQQLSQAMASDMNYSYMKPNGYIYDKDALDRARNQQNWLQNSIWTVGSGWEKRAANMNPYTDQDLIAHAYESASSMPRLVGEVGTTLVPAIGSPGKVLKAVGASYLGSKATDLGIRTFSNYKGWNDMASKKWGWSDTEGNITNPGMWLGGFGYGRLSKAWNNPNSLLSRNIRTAFANDKTPYGYVLLDPQNILPYIKGAYNTIRGKQIPLKNFEIPYELENTLMNFNRYKVWRKYLGVGDDIENLRMISGITDNSLNRGRYIKQNDGTYDYTFTPDEEVALLPTNVFNDKSMFSIKNDGSFLTSDFIIGNHGNVGGKLKYNANGKVIAEIEDPWDLNPFRKYIPKKLRPYLDLEMSKFLPAGVKSFTLKHTIPITDNILGIDTTHPIIGKPSRTFNLNTIDDVIKASKIGGFIRKK